MAKQMREKELCIREWPTGVFGEIRKRHFKVSKKSKQKFLM
jgi:hypothetical protein